jgi:ribonuclease J
MARLTLTPLGGLGEIGRNLFVVEVDGGRLVVDAGLSFPSSELPGVDVVLPDMSYLKAGPPITGVVLTHAHEDHVGAIPWLLEALDAPVYGTPFTLALVRHRLAERGQTADLRPFGPGHVEPIGPFSVEPYRVTHSVPDAVGIIVSSAAGRLVHTGDFKLDGMPIDGQLTNLTRLEEVGHEGVDVLLSDSTNATVPGVTASETAVEAAFGRWVPQAQGMVVIALFSSHLHRVAHVLRLADRLGKRVLLLGRSLLRNVELAQAEGLLNPPEGVLVEFDNAPQVPRHKLLVVATGAQGEVRSGLMTLTDDSPGPLRLQAGDWLILSARTIPGNEVPVTQLVNRALMRGARVVTPDDDRMLHVSGHAARDEQRQVLQLVKPKHFVPVHGEYRHLSAHRALAHEAGLAESQVSLLTDGQQIQLENGAVVHRQQVAAGTRLVRREGVGEVLMEAVLVRRHLAQAGVVTIVVAIDDELRIRVAPRCHGHGLTTDELAALPMAQEGAALALQELAKKHRGDDAKVEEALIQGARRVFKQLLGARPWTMAIVVRIPS